MSDSQRPTRAESWLDVYCMYKRELMVIAWNLTGQTELAEDAIHDAFARLLERNLSDVADYRTYAFQTVRNSAHLLMRQRRRPAAPAHVLPLDDIAAAEARLEHLQRDRQELITEIAEVELQAIESRLAELPEPEDTDALRRVWRDHRKLLDLKRACEEELLVLDAKIAVLKRRVGQLNGE